MSAMYSVQRQVEYDCAMNTLMIGDTDSPMRTNSEKNAIAILLVLLPNKSLNVPPTTANGQLV